MEIKILDYYVAKSYNSPNATLYVRVKSDVIDWEDFTLNLSYHEWDGVAQWSIETDSIHQYADWINMEGLTLFKLVLARVKDNIILDFENSQLLPKKSIAYQKGHTL